MTNRGATPAYRGYRMQALYTLSRILDGTEAAPCTIQAEGFEDLAVYNQADELVEVVQVKAYTSPLTLSDFDPSVENSFFHRAIGILEKNPHTNVKIVSFGLIGPEMEEAWRGVEPHRARVLDKLRNSGFSSVDADKLLRTVQLVRLSDTAILFQVLTAIRQTMLGIDAEAAFEMLSYWLYVAAENHRNISHNDVMARITSIGRYLAETAAHHQEWFTSILPIEDKAIVPDEAVGLRRAFYEGMPARYAHVLAGIDVVRPNRLQEIHDGFGNTRIVILHGASGQGKSTLAYRYLHDYVPDKWRFEVHTFADRSHALRIARALAGHAGNVQVPMYILLDVSPRTVDWTEIVRELADDPNIHLLITVREEDWRRAQIKGTELKLCDIDLSFDESEARGLFAALTSEHPSDVFLTFEDAWQRFGSQGPLLEFTYLVTQHTSLRDRLAGQVERLQDEVRRQERLANELELLRLVSVAGAYEAEVDAAKLASCLQLSEPVRTLDLFEQEYLLRKTDNGRLVGAFHSIRSTILVELLTDSIFKPWGDLARDCLLLIAEDYLEDFLFYAFSRHSKDEIAPLLQAVLLFQPTTWAGYAGVIRALLWLGIQEYIGENTALINESYQQSGVGWSMVLDSDIAGLLPAESSMWWKNLGAMGESAGARAEPLRSRQTPKDRAFARVGDWLSKSRTAPRAPFGLADWRGVSEVAFWTGFLKLEGTVIESVSTTMLEEAVQVLPVEVLADVILGLSYGWGSLFPVRYEPMRPIILAHFRAETRTIAVEDDGNTIRAHFVIDHTVVVAGQQDARRSQHGVDPLHDEAMQRVRLLRKLVPDRQNYGCQGYGHRLGSLTIPLDNTTKTGIPINSLPPMWAVQSNATFRQLGIHGQRPESWQGHANSVIAMRQTVLATLEQLDKALPIYFRKRTATNLLAGHIDLNAWQECQLKTHLSPLLPKCAVDEWGFVGEDQPMDAVSPMLSEKSSQYGLALWKYKPYMSALRDFTVGVNNFLQQAPHVIARNAILRQASTQEQKRAAFDIAAKQGVKAELSHTSIANLAQAVEALPRLQTSFRDLLASLSAGLLLDNLEQQERNILRPLWPLWYEFVEHPHEVLQSADQEMEQDLKHMKRQMLQELNRGLRKLRQEGIEANISETSAQWDTQPCLWITYDVASPIQMYAAFERVADAVCKVFHHEGSTQQRRDLFAQWWSAVAIVPLVAGQATIKAAWHVNTILLLSGKVWPGTDWWHRVLLPIKETTWAALGLKAWVDPRLDVVARLSAAVIDLSAVIAHLADLLRAPDTDDVGTDILRQYLEEIQEPFSAQLQKVINAAAELLATLNALLPDALKDHPELTAIVECLIMMKDNILPSHGLNGKVSLSLKQMGEWATRLESARGQAETVRLLWIAYCLGLPVPIEGDPKSAGE